MQALCWRLPYKFYVNQYIGAKSSFFCFSSSCKLYSRSVETDQPAQRFSQTVSSITVPHHLCGLCRLVHRMAHRLDSISKPEAYWSLLISSIPHVCQWIQAPSDAEWKSDSEYWRRVFGVYWRLIMSTSRWSIRAKDTVTVQTVRWRRWEADCEFSQASALLL